MAKELKAAQEALNEKDQTPQVNKDTLKEAIGKAEALDLTQYKEEGKAEFNAALQNAKAVLEKADADQDEIDFILICICFFKNSLCIEYGNPESETGRRRKRRWKR